MIMYFAYVNSFDHANSIYIVVFLLLLYSRTPLCYALASPLIPHDVTLLIHCAHFIRIVSVPLMVPMF